MRLQTSERVDIADGPVDSRSKVSPPIARLVSENPLREPWIFVEGEDHTKDHYHPLTDKEWVKWRNEDPESFDDRYELCEEGREMLRIPTSEAGTETPSSCPGNRSESHWWTSTRNYSHQCATLWGASTWPCWTNLDPRSLTSKGENKRNEPAQHSTAQHSTAQHSTAQHPRKKDLRLWRSENWRPCYKWPRTKEKNGRNKDRRKRRNYWSLDRRRRP